MKAIMLVMLMISSIANAATNFDFKFTGGSIGGYDAPIKSGTYEYDNGDGTTSTDSFTRFYENKDVKANVQASAIIGSKTRLDFDFNSGMNASKYQEDKSLSVGGVHILSESEDLTVLLTGSVTLGGTKAYSACYSERQDGLTHKSVCHNSEIFDGQQDFDATNEINRLNKSVNMGKVGNKIGVKFIWKI